MVVNTFLHGRIREALKCVSLPAHRMHLQSSGRTQRAPLIIDLWISVYKINSLLQVYKWRLDAMVYNHVEI